MAFSRRDCSTKHRFHSVSHFYISTYIGKGVIDDPFRPFIGSNDEWSAIDLRPNGRSDGGRCLLWVPEPITDSRVLKIGEGKLENISSSTIRAIESKLLLAADAVSRKPTLGESLFDLLRSPPTGAVWRALAPDKKRGAYVVLLGPKGSPDKILFEEPYAPPRNSQSYTDDFTSGNLAANWTILDPTYDDSANTLRCNDLSAWMRYNSALDTTDMEVELEYLANVAPGAIKGGGPTARVNASSTETYYNCSARVTDNDIELAYYDDGSFNLLGSRLSHTMSANEVLKVHCSGDTITGYVDSTEVESVTNSSIASTTRAGVRSFVNSDTGYLEFDNWAAQDLVAGTTPKGPLGHPLHGALGGPI